MLKDLNLVGGMTNTDWLNQFHDEMRMHKITQGQLATTADYSRSHLNQLLTGNKPINQQARLRLTLAMRSLTGQNNIGSSPKCWCKLNSANLSFHKLKHTGFF